MDSRHRKKKLHKEKVKLKKHTINLDRPGKLPVIEVGPDPIELKVNNDGKINIIRHVK